MPSVKIIVRDSADIKNTMTEAYSAFLSPSTNLLALENNTRLSVANQPPLCHHNIFGSVPTDTLRYLTLRSLIQSIYRTNYGLLLVKMSV